MAHSSAGTPTKDDPGSALFELLYRQHAEDLYRYARRFLNDPHRAEDVVQEVLLRAWRHPDKLLGAQARPWLFAVARNYMIDLCRSGRRGHLRLDRSENLPEGPEEDLYERLLEDWEVAAALESLSPDHRQILWYTYFLGWSVSKVAAHLNLPEGTVKSRVHYALKSLKAALGARGVTR